MKQLPEDLLVLGNLEPVGVLESGTSESVGQETKKLLEATREFSSFILSSGCDVPPGIPIDNINSMFRTLEQLQR